MYPSAQNIPEADHWPAATKWTLKGLESYYGDVEVTVRDLKNLPMTLTAFMRYV